MNRKRKVLVLLLLLAAAVIAYILLGNYNDQKSEEEAQAEEDSIIHVIDMEDITGFSYTGAEDASMAFSKEDDTWVYDEDTEIPMNQDSVESLAEALGNVEASREFTEADDLADYGLATPTYTINVSNSDEETQLLIGNSVDSSGEEYYLKLDTTDTVYTIPGTLVSSLVFDVTSLVQMEEIPTLSSDAISKVTIAQGDSSNTYEADNEEQAETFEDITTDLSIFYFYSCVSYNATEEELEGYGLGESGRTTVTVTYTDDDDQEQTYVLYIGDLDSSSTYRYVQVEGSTFVYEVTMSLITSLVN
ncbi:MAG: DUF4340 domain-containing protein [Lachnospiraceae bacterium]